jgi:hypothetical protein
MKRRCLPCYLIIRNIVMLLVATAGLVLVSADLQARANRADGEATALRQLFVYQLLSRMEPE